MKSTIKRDFVKCNEVYDNLSELYKNNTLIGNRINIEIIQWL